MATERLSTSGTLVRIDRATGSLRSREYHVSVVGGPDSGKSISLEGPSVVGTDPNNALVLTDSAVSRQHVELTPRADGIFVRDLQSTNGTFIGGARVDHAVLEHEGTIKLGRSLLRVAVVEQDLGMPEGPPDLGGAIGGSRAMRKVFGVIGKVAPSNSPVVLLGETGTGKEVLARAIHTLSKRARGPFVVFDCGAVSPNLIESELFGHVRGAFTDARADHNGAFLQADGGTLFLDEIGELPLELQPKLLRALEAGEVKRIGEERYRSVDVRIVAATHRDLEAEVKAGRFRQDLFFRLAVVLVKVPPLRERLDDLPKLAQHFLKQLGHGDFHLSQELLERLCAYHWPGNVRELRNVVARAVMDESIALADSPQSPSQSSARRTTSREVPAVDLPFKEAKERLVDSFTRDYLEALLAKHGGNITRAAKAAGIARPYVHKLVQKYGLKGD